MKTIALLTLALTACAPVDLGQHSAALDLDGVTFTYDRTGGTCGHALPDTFALTFEMVWGWPVVADPFYEDTWCEVYGTGTAPERYLACHFAQDTQVVVTDLRDMTAVVALAACADTYSVTQEIP